MRTRRAALSIAAALASLWSGSVAAQSNGPSWTNANAFRGLRYADYPARRFTARHVTPDFAGSARPFRSYRTRIRAAAREGISFAGHYAVSAIMCGSGCLLYYLIDLSNGHVIGDLPFGGENYGKVIYRRDSNLLFSSYHARSPTGWRCRYEAYAMTQGRFRLLARYERPVDGLFAPCGNEPADNPSAHK